MHSILVPILLFFVLLSSAHGTSDQMLLQEEDSTSAADKISYPVPPEEEGHSGVSKRDLEFNQYVPAYRLRGEPTCEELRTMWRLSKREARRATSTNHIPRARPYSYGRLMAFAGPSSHNRQQFVYGEPRNFAGKGGGAGSLSPVKGSFNKLIGMLGGGGGVGGGRAGSFSRLRGMVSSQRLPGQTPKGKYNELRDMVLDYHMDKSSSPKVSPSIRSSVGGYHPVRRASQYKWKNDPDRQISDTDLVKAILDGEQGSKNVRIPAWNIRTKMSCIDVQDIACNSNSECVCAGQYRCSNGRCKGFAMHYGRSEDFILRNPLVVAAE